MCTMIVTGHKNASPRGPRNLPSARAAAKTNNLDAKEYLGTEVGKRTSNQIRLPNPWPQSESKKKWTPGGLERSCFGEPFSYTAVSSELWLFGFATLVI